LTRRGRHHIIVVAKTSKRLVEAPMMIWQDGLPVTLVKLVDHVPTPTPPAKRGPGRPRVYTDRLFLKALVVLDSTVLRARGGVWHKKDREAGKVAHTCIDTEAHWTKSGWHGWVYGWKLHLATTVAGVWITLAARLTPANEADSDLAPRLLEELPEEARFFLDDTHYNAPEVRELCEGRDRILVASRHGPYPHADPGVGIRRVFHELRSRAIENFNGQFKSIFDGQGQVPTKGLANTARFALGAVFVYQMALLHQYEHDRDLRIGLKAFLKAA
jgi:hypothetical protein